MEKPIARTLEEADALIEAAEKAAKEMVGELFLADIGIPQNVYRDYGVDKAELFKGNKIVPL